MVQGRSIDSGPGPGDRVARYTLRRLLAAGASGQVFLAEDTATGVWAALKVMRPAGELSPEERTDQRQRFQQEAQAARRLDHPNIVRVLDAGEDHGQLWVAMEPVPGCTLQRYTEAARLLPPDIAIDIGRQLADALAHAHDAGIVHRDLKPSNVLVDLPTGLVKLTDFGIARLDDGTRTRTGVMLGTPSYMAPEQLTGGVVDARADLYALGVLLFELLTGRRPHESASMGDFLRAVLSEPAPDLRAHWSAAPPELAALLAALLAKPPSARPPSARDAAKALARVRLHDA